MAARATRAGLARGFYLVALAVGALGAVATGVVLAGAVLLLPSLLMLAAEPMPGRPMGRAMALFGLASCLSLLVAIWGQGGAMVDGLAALSDVYALGRAWAAQAVAWLLCEAIPVLLVFQSEFLSARELRRLREARQSLLNDWGR